MAFIFFVAATWLVRILTVAAKIAIAILVAWLLYKQSKSALTEKMNNINRSFAFIHQATMLRAGIYCDIGELGPMASVLEEYSYFIENDISRHAQLLALHDINDDGTANGIWASRVQLKLETSDLTKMLHSTPKTLYLGIAQEESE